MAPVEDLRELVSKVKEAGIHSDKESQSLTNLKKRWGQQLLGSNVVVLADEPASLVAAVPAPSSVPPALVGLPSSMRDLVNLITQEIDKDLALGEIAVEMMKRGYKTDSPEMLRDAVYKEAVEPLIQLRILMPVGEAGKTKYRRCERSKK